MKKLNLIIKQEFFDQIVNGTKTKEYREVKPTTIKKLLQLDCEGYEIEDSKGNAQPIKYDAVQLYVGYRKDRDTALVEVMDAHCEIITDAKGEPIMYRHGRNRKTGEPMIWVKEQVVYNLGKVMLIKSHNNLSV